MRMDASGLALVKAFEGCLKPIKNNPGCFTTYRCPAGVLTIGFGHTNLAGVPPRVTDGAVWSRKECEDALASDLRKFERRVASILAGVPLTSYEFSALVSFDFNTGGLDRSSIPAKIRTGRRAEVPVTLARWNKANGKVLNGLTRRRAAEAALFEGKVDEALRIAGIARGAAAMPRRADRPTAPAAQVARRTRSEQVAAVAGGTVATGSMQIPEEAAGVAPWMGIGLGAVIVAAAVAAILIKYRKIDADWA